MRVIYESRIDGKFEGWRRDATYKLQNRTKWKLVSKKNKYKFSISPRATVWQEGRSYYLEVRGIHSIEKVRRVFDSA